ncbi:GIY-YIG nuclease family protein [Melioribacter sp. Ez-97]|uniref:GIY-YIG nuclease family protein n=1 Tax=Melioribacter sp. Ez-97 TaxID=3423434 RepID=UPI003ED8566C
MPKITDQVSDSGIYLLEIVVPDDFYTEIKKYEGRKFPKGFYYYAGSAQKNMRKRLERHLKKNKNIYWHIDYLTSRFNIGKIFYFNNCGKEFECDLVADLIEKFGLIPAAPGFGNSDCNRCDSHLLYSEAPLDYSHFISRYQSIARFIPSSNDTF